MPDGGWEIDAAGSIGSPVTYGRVLATRMAVGTLAAADRTKYCRAIAKAQGWLETTEPRSVLDAAAKLLALIDVVSPAARAGEGGNRDRSNFHVPFVLGTVSLTRRQPARS